MGVNLVAVYDDWAPASIVDPVTHESKGGFYKDVIVTIAKNLNFTIRYGKREKKK